MADRSEAPNPQMKDERGSPRGLRRWAVEQAIAFAAPGGAVDLVLKNAEAILVYVTKENSQ